MRKYPENPAWGRGVQLVRVTSDSLHVIGDIENPLSLHGVSQAMADWLSDFDGSCTWRELLADAASRGITVADARSALTHLVNAGLVVDVTQLDACNPAAEIVMLGSAQFAEAFRMLGTADDRLLIPGGDAVRWVELTDQAIDSGRTVILALNGVVADAAEVRAGRELQKANRDYLVVGAGANTVRVGPMAGAGAACLNCEDLARADLDPHWLAVSATAATQPNRPHAHEIFVAAGATEALRQIDALLIAGGEVCRNQILQTGHRGGPWWRRPLALHPACDCWTALVA